ncbi:Capsule assembly protein Wzi [Bryocella elongata]|uniref:Capsule assembly protein Wzi n=1 Tax=Bryocella elongata TaxID=863522 RepID=A0A1H5ST37_9BACT|nr:capsule assembly Wzi family protein [Bryocella elongata]SEF53128.1 Capsule assembly protein Wzi [Bryocella elongata]
MLASFSFRVVEAVAFATLLGMPGLVLVAEGELPSRPVDLPAIVAEPVAGTAVNPLPAPSMNPAVTTAIVRAVSPWSAMVEGKLPLGMLPDDDRVGSPTVPMDSWIYPALERLSTYGLIPSQQTAIRPWTRQECRRQVTEAMLLLRDMELSDGPDGQARSLLAALDEELLAPSDGFKVETVYARAGTIAGPALADSFHIGQTWWNDYGRQLGRGSDAIAGVSMRWTHGRFFFYDRQEGQYGPGAAAINASQAQLFTQLDMMSGNPVPSPATFYATAAQPAYARQRPLELYAGIAFGGNELSFGKQELYWGPGTMGPWSFSMNAEPNYNLRFEAERPHPFPFVPSWGSYRFSLVFGKLSGHHFPARPYYNAQKADFTFGQGKYVEMSFTRWSLLWGVGHPMTLGSLYHNLVSSNSEGSQYGYFNRTDPGDRKSDFDMRVHVPGLSHLLTIYADAFADDEVNPIDAPRRVPWDVGMYLASVPGLPKLDFRLEAATSEELSQDEGGQRFFINSVYLDANTNKSFLLGNAVGRDARAIEGRVGYWFTARTRVEAGYRQNKGGTQYLPGGATISDGFARGTYALTHDTSLQVFVQRERFLIPSYEPGSQHNTSGWFQVTWTSH